MRCTGQQARALSYSGRPNSTAHGLLPSRPHHHPVRVPLRTPTHLEADDRVASLQALPAAERRGDEDDAIRRQADSVADAQIPGEPLVNLVCSVH